MIAELLCWINAFIALAVILVASIGMLVDYPGEPQVRSMLYRWVAVCWALFAGTLLVLAL